MKTAIRLLLVPVLLAGCLGSGAAPAGIAGRTFLSTLVTQGGVERPLVAGTRIRLSFADGSRISASAGCNILGGSYRLDGATLRFEGGGMTEMGCDPARHAQDDWLFKLLGSGPTVRLTGNDLLLTAGDTAVTLLDREIAEPDLPLVGPTWTVSSLISADTVSSIPDGAVATLEFLDGGRVAISTGCNEAGGTFAVDGNRVRFADLVTTDRACPGAGDDLEAAVLEVLDAPDITWVIDASSLTLMAGQRGLQLGGS